MKKILYLIILLTIPMNILADSYSSLWKKADDASKKDLPKTQIQWLDKIIAKAEGEKAYGQLMKAQLLRSSLRAQIAPDSLDVEIARLERKALTTKDKTLQAVYASALGKIYQEHLEDDAVAKSKRWFKLSMQNPALLAQHKSEEYEPAIVKGVDSRIFNEDLLHVIGLEAEDYSTLHDYYSKTGNRPAACITACYKLRQERGNYTAVANKSVYLQRVDSLIKVYADLPMAGELAIEHDDYLAQCPDASAEERVKYINYALNQWGAWPRMNILRNALAELERPSFNINIGDCMLLPNVKRKVLVNSIRNINELHVKIYRVDVSGKTKLNPNKAQDYKALQKHIVPDFERSVTRRYIGQPAWKENCDSILLEGMPVGVYLMEASTDNKGIKPQRALLRVSDLYVMSEGRPDKRVRFVVVSATTGKPIEGAHIELTTNASFDNEKESKASILSGQNGEVNYAYKGRMPNKIYVFTDKDRACGNFDIDAYYSYWDEKSVRKDLYAYTDRSVYRPGQQVHAVAIATEIDSKSVSSKALDNEPLTITLRDANGKEVGKKEVMTDAFGTASTMFTLPANGLTGSFYIRMEGRNLYAGTTLQVEQYKRPTYQIEFEPYKKAYQIGDVVKVRGVAKSFAGVPVQGAKVEYTVKRNKSMWSRWSDGNWSDNLLTESTVTADDGSFFLKMPMTLPPNVNMELPLYYNVVANAKVTDLSGETHEGTTSLPLSNRTRILDCDIPSKTLRDSLRNFSFTLRNVAGEVIEGKVRYKIDNEPWQTTDANKPVAIARKLTSGQHTITGICDNDTVKKQFIIFSYEDKKPAIETPHWFYVSDNRFHADGKPVYIQVGSSDSDVHLYYTALSGERVIDEGRATLNNEVLTKKLVYKEAYGDGVTINMAWVKRGHLFRHTVQLLRPEPDSKLKLSWKTFRDRLAPGQKEEWTLRILTPDGKPAQAQLLATMYDKSLDGIVKHQWHFSPHYQFSLPQTEWHGGSDDAIGLYGFANYKRLPERMLAFSHYYKSMFYIAPPYVLYESMTTQAPNGLRTRAMGAGISIAKNELAKSAAVAETGGGYAADSVYQEVTELSALDNAPNNQATGMDGGNKQGNATQQPRENLNETAFFFPTLMADSQGNVNIKFTLPESVTTWRFMAIAHDKQMNHGQLSAEAVAKKDVMVQPNLPRFIRMGDKAQISGRIYNTAEKNINGMARFQLLDPETEAVVAEWEKAFDVARDMTTTVYFDVDADRLAANAKGRDLFIARVMVEGNGFSDGEQHYLPLLPNREYVTTTVPFTQNGAGTKTIDLSKLFPNADAQNKLTIEYTNHPAWLMAQALPSIASPCDKDAISLATAIYANSIGQSLLNSSPKIKRTVEMWKKETREETSLMSSLRKNQELKTMVLSETPWVANAEREADQKQQLANFLDETAIGYRVDDFTTKLQALQNSDGSFSWWPGMAGSSYITMSVAQILTRLDAMIGTKYVRTNMLNQAFGYLDRRIAEEARELKKAEKKGQKHLSPSELACNYLYTCALAKRPESQDMNYLVALLEKMPTELTIYGKAGCAVILSQYGKERRAKEYLRSINEHSVYKAEMGRYFDTHKAFYSWFDYKIPTQTFAIEAMKRLNPADTKTIEEMQRWLLQEKRATGWDTPINAVNAVYAFMGNNEGGIDMSKLASGMPTTLKINGQALKTPQATAGLGYVKTTVKGNKATTFTAEKTSQGTSWGALYAQYWQKASDVKAASSGLVVKREICSTDGKKIANRLKVGDKVRVRITIAADRDYDFVQVRDKRAACLEPAEQLSGYHWGYYLAPQDNATNYYFDRLAKGKHIVETDYYVDREGDYTTGTCTAQCAYSPEYSGREGAKELHVTR